MQGPLTDKTNVGKDKPMKSRNESDKDKVVVFLKEVTNRTKDYNLKYDIIKCIEILEGKENQETIDLKDALEEVLQERELLFKEKCELAVELDMYKMNSNMQK